MKAAVIDDIRDGVDRETIETVQAMAGKYKYGWETDIETEYAPKGLSEDIVRLISEKNGEPEWMLDWRLAAYRRWVQMEEPRWAMLHYPEIDYQDQYYYAKPKSMATKPKSLDEVDPKLLATYAKLGIPLKEQALLAGVEAPEGERKVAVDAVFDSVSVGTTFKAELAKAGVIFCPISEAIRDYPDLVKKYLGTVVPQSDNFFATLNSAVFSDGSFVYIPEGVRCPMELSTYFRINAENTGQFERTLIIADEEILRQLPGRLHGAQARHPPAARRGGGNRRARGRRGQILHRTELVSGRRRGPWRHLQLCHQARRLPRRPVQGDVDAGRNRVSDHLEIPLLHPARRRFAGRVLLDRHRQQRPAGRYRHQDGAPGQAHQVAHRVQGHLGGPGAEHLSRPRLDAPQGQGQPQLYPVRQPA
jgi:hypothetical protein